MNIKVRTAVIGAGASGLAAAITAGEKKSGKTIIIEKQDRAGRKLLATGNGRCNISNLHIFRDNYHGDRAIIDRVLSNYPYERAERMCNSLGFLLRSDSEGRVYPMSNRSDTVLDCMLRKLRSLSVDIMYGEEIRFLGKPDDKFCIVLKNDTVYADNIIMAAGSYAAPHLGSDKSAVKLMYDSFGFKYNTMYPALCPVICREKYASLKGVRAKGSVSLIADDNIIKTESGEIQFNDTGLSGICIFNLSGYVNEFLLCGTADGNNCKKIKISVDLMPDRHERDIIGFLRKCRRIFSGEDNTLLLSGLFDKKLSAVLMKCISAGSVTCEKLSEDDLRKAAHIIKNFEFTPSRISDVRNAQTAAGGYGSSIVEPATLMCRKVRNLFICGELLDVYGDCGGYNLHFAFGSGIMAAENIK